MEDWGEPKTYRKEQFFKQPNSKIKKKNVHYCEGFFKKKLKVGNSQVV